LAVFETERAGHETLSSLAGEYYEFWPNMREKEGKSLLGGGEKKKKAVSMFPSAFLGGCKKSSDNTEKRKDVFISQNMRRRSKFTHYFVYACERGGRRKRIT